MPANDALNIDVYPDTVSPYSGLEDAVRETETDKMSTEKEKQLAEYNAIANRIANELHGGDEEIDFDDPEQLNRLIEEDAKKQRARCKRLGRVFLELDEIEEPTPDL